MIKKIKIFDGRYEYKGYIIDRQDRDINKPYVHWNIGQEVKIFNSEHTEIDWHDGANTLKDAMYMIDDFAEVKGGTQ
jgi:hypothetical protein